ncbi:MAG: sigma-E processing peptidase SpoIIGA [Clostridia bacterium]|nr:sigma-E processing peptidase SpoIIGA [Clostridia bacterium]
MTIYLDIFFFKNVIFNFLLIYLTSTLIRRKVRMTKILLASIVGGIYAIASLCWAEIFNSIMLKIIISIVMLLITFGIKEIKAILSSFFSLSYITAGVIASLLKMDNQIVLLLFALSMIMIFYIYEKNKKYNEYYEVRVEFLKEELNMLAKLDTGNELRDTLFGYPVIVASEEKIKGKVDEELIKILNNERLEIPEIYKNKIKLISFKTISGEGIKTGIKVDKIIIYEGTKQIEGKAIMILSERDFKKYDLLIGKKVLEGGFYYESDGFNKIENKGII